MVRPLSISDKLYLTIPVYDADNKTIVAYAHSAPISQEVFEAHFLLLGAAFSQLHRKGLGIVSGPRVAALLVRKVAEEQGDELGGISLMNEIRRLTNFVRREPDGWVTRPFQEVVDHALLPPEDVSEVLNQIVFFIVTSAIQQRHERKEMMDGAARIWGSRTSSSDFTAFVASLGTSTKAAVTRTTESLPVY